MIKVSVITPVYNMRNYIKNTIESVLNQTIKELEMVCIDDGSTDNSSEIVEKYVRKDERVRLLRITNQGAGKARNLGISIAQGEYVFFLDADDWLYDCNALENLYVAAKQNDMDVCGGRIAQCIDDTYKIFREHDIYGNEIFIDNSVIEFKDYQCSFYYWRYIYRRKMLINNGLTFPNYKRYQDPPFFLNVMAECSKFMTVSEIIYCYRCSHKRIKWTEDKVSDLFKGIRDSLAIARKMKWEQAYVTDFKKLCEEYIDLAIYARSYNVLKMAEEIIDSVDVEILKSKRIEYEDICPDLSKIKNEIGSVIQYEEFLLEKIKTSKQIILYGAGKIGNRMLDYINEYVNNQAVVFAISDGQDKNVSVNDVLVYYINELLEYKNNAEVIVTVSKKLQREIEQNLKKLGFKNIILLDIDKFSYFI